MYDIVNVARAVKRGRQDVLCYFSSWVGFVIRHEENKFIDQFMNISRQGDEADVLCRL